MFFSHVFARKSIQKSGLFFTDYCEEGKIGNLLYFDKKFIKLPKEFSQFFYDSRNNEITFFAEIVSPTGFKNSINIIEIRETNLDLKLGRYSIDDLIVNRKTFLSVMMEIKEIQKNFKG